jgi:hypothetical protein
VAVVQTCIGPAEMGEAGLLVKLETGNKDCEWIYRFWANPGRPRGGIVPPAPVLAPGSALGFPAPGLPYPPPRLPECNSADRVRANSFFLTLARRRPSACDSSSRRAAQIASARPANLSAGLTYAIALCRRTCCNGSRTRRPTAEHVHTEFDRRECLACPGRPLCRRATTEGRETTLRPRERHEAPQAARVQQDTAEWKRE